MNHYKKTHNYCWSMVLLAEKRLSVSKDAVDLEILYEWENLFIRLKYYRYIAKHLNVFSPRMSYSIVKQFDTKISGGKHRGLANLPSLDSIYNFDAHLLATLVKRKQDISLTITANCEEYAIESQKYELSKVMQAATELRDGVMFVSCELIEW